MIVETDIERLRRLRKGVMPIYEPGLDMGYDVTNLRVDLAFRGTATVIPTNPTQEN